MVNLFSGFAALINSDECGGSFLGFPKWYSYLQSDSANACSPAITGLSDIWLIVAAVIEILLRIAALVAAVFVISGGFKYITSQGEPENTAHARGAIINALIGLVIAVSAAVIIGYIARSIK